MKEVRDLLIGIEINEDFSQIAYYDRKKKEPVCVPVKPGTEDFLYPTLMSKMQDKDSFYVCQGAKDSIELGESEAIPDFYSAISGHEKVRVGASSFEPWQLLSVYIRGMLMTLGVRDILDNIKGLMITSYETGRDFAENSMKAMEQLGLKKGSFFVQDHMESFYYYCISQNMDLYKKKAGVFNYTKDRMKFESLVLTRDTNPNIARVTEDDGIAVNEADENFDERILVYSKEKINEGEYGLIYINNRTFDREKLKQTVEFLCGDFRRVFAGDNLYIKGACYGALERAEENRHKNILYIGTDMLRANVGMELLAGERKVYYPVITAGLNWFEADKTFTVMPLDSNKLVFRVTSIDGKNARDVSILLTGLEKRPAGTTKLMITVKCTSATKYTITAEDIGFGDMFPATGLKWTGNIEILDDFWLNGGIERFDNRIFCRLCRVPVAKTPFHIDSAGINLYSIEEFCYFVFRYPELVDGEVINRSLCIWFRDELGLGRLSQLMSSAIKKSDDIMAIFSPIFDEAEYLTKKDQSSFEKRINAFAENAPTIRYKKKGDALVHYKKYNAALKSYRLSERLAKEEQGNGAFLSSLYNNMGTVYMRKLLYEEALECFKQAYSQFHTRDALMTYLLAAAIARPKSKYEEIVAALHIAEPIKRDVDERIKQALAYEVPSDDRSPSKILEVLINNYHNSSGMALY